MGLSVVDSARVRVTSWRDCVVPLEHVSYKREFLSRRSPIAITDITECLHDASPYHRFRQSDEGYPRARRFAISLKKSAAASLRKRRVCRPGMLTFISRSRLRCTNATARVDVFSTIVAKERKERSTQRRCWASCWMLRAGTFWSFPRCIMRRRAAFRQIREDAGPLDAAWNATRDFALRWFFSSIERR